VLAPSSPSRLGNICHVDRKGNVRNTFFIVDKIQNSGNELKATRQYVPNVFLNNGRKKTFRFWQFQCQQYRSFLIYDKGRTTLNQSEAVSYDGRVNAISSRKYVWLAE